MKAFGIAVGLTALLAAGSARAGLTYDTITNQTATANSKLTVASGLPPAGEAFKAPSQEQLASVTVQLIDPQSNTNDGGSILVYVVPGVSGNPSATGLTLNNPIYIGTILDSSLTGGGVNNNVTVTPTTAPSLAQGNWWIMLTSGADPNNFYQTKNPNDTTAKWNEVVTTVALANGAIGISASGNTQAFQSPANSGVLLGSRNDVFMMQVNAPEPTSLAILGAGLAGLGFRLRRRGKKTSG